jgi:hypothetical protein
MELTMNELIQDFTNNISYCKHVIGCNEEQTNELIQAADELGVSAEYFCEEFIVAPEGEECMKYQDGEFLDIDSFNTYHGIYFEYEVD